MSRNSTLVDKLDYVRSAFSRDGIAALRGTAWTDELLDYLAEIRLSLAHSRQCPYCNLFREHGKKTCGGANCQSHLLGDAKRKHVGPLSCEFCPAAGGGCIVCQTEGE